MHGAWLQRKNAYGGENTSAPACVDRVLVSGGSGVYLTSPNLMAPSGGTVLVRVGRNSFSVLRRMTD